MSDREIRKLINTKQNSIEFYGKPSVSTMLDGQLAIEKKTNSQVAIYRKKFGKLFKSYMSSNGDEIIDRDLNVGGLLTASVIASDLILKKGKELTIASGVVSSTRSFHTVDTESDASSDNLDTINGGRTGQILIIKPANGGRTIVIRHDEGNIFTSDTNNISLTESNSIAVLIKDDSKWFVLISANFQ